MGSDIVSDSISVTSSNYVFRQTMGREYLPDILIYSDHRYHAFADNSYPFPADETESCRLDALHDMNKILFDKNVFAPIEHSLRLQIVDFGTGSGMASLLKAYDREMGH
jgi:hypothetical protein